MKPIRPIRDAGFTLIELLVVISIIALLASIAVPTANIVLRKAKETQARAGVHGLAIGVKNYQAEYNRLPNPNAGSAGVPTETPIDTDSSNDIVKMLVGKDPIRNPREIPFYDPPQARNEANGLIVTGTSYQVVDPWSRPGAHQYFHLALDYNGDHVIINPVKADSSKFSPAYISAEPQDLSTEIAVYSDGDPRIASASRRPITSW